MWLALSLACAPREVEITGTVYAGPATDALAAPGTAVRIRDDAASLYDEATVADDGTFRVLAPEGAEIFAEIGAPAVPATVFGGYAGLDDFEAVPGSLFSGEALADWLAPFAGCPGLGAGAAVVGEVVYTELRDPETGARVAASGALVKVAVHGSDADLVSACFLDDEGAAWSPDATVAGATGRFVVAGLPSGFHQLRIGFQPLDEGFDFTFWEVWVPQDGVSPWFPAEIDFLE